jgi:hypothetical protein
MQNTTYNSGMWCICSLLIFGLIFAGLIFYIYTRKCDKKERYVSFQSGRNSASDDDTRKKSFRGYSDCLTMCSKIHPTGFVDGKELPIDTMGILRYDCIDKCEKIMESYFD